MKTQPNKGAGSTAEVFTELYRENLPKVFRYIDFRVRNTQLAEDLTSATFEKALTGFSKYRPDRAAFSTWLFTIARNTVISYFRTSARQNVSLEQAEQIVSNDSSPEDEIIRNEEKQHLRVCVSKLSPEEQELISLKFGAEVTNREIARMLGLSESNVGVKLFRAICKLRDWFKEG